jgi:Glyoxalase-like domain
MLDHLVYGVPDLEQGVRSIEVELGVWPAYGGKHAGGLTHNALLSLGEGTYLEIIAPVPGVEVPAAALPFGLGALTVARLAAWAAAVEDLDGTIEAARAAGYDPGALIEGGRDLPDGSHLSWRLAVRPQPAGDGLVPFLIQWISEPHPSATAPKGCHFLELRAEHPEPESVHQMLRALGVDLAVATGDEPRLIATLDSPNGRVELS